MINPPKQKATVLTAGSSSGENVSTPQSSTPNDIAAGIMRRYQAPLGA